MDLSAVAAKLVHGRAGSWGVSFSPVVFCRNLADRLHVVSMATCTFIHHAYLATLQIVSTPHWQLQSDVGSNLAVFLTSAGEV